MSCGYVIVLPRIGRTFRIHRLAKPQPCHPQYRCARQKLTQAVAASTVELAVASPAMVNFHTNSCRSWIEWVCDAEIANSVQVIAGGDSNEDAVIMATAKALAE